ncbi:MAG: sodium:proton antiporter, partial [Synechococcales cyanobacterium]
MGAILAYVVLDTIVNGDPDPMGAIMGLIMRLGVGGIIGVLGGLVMSMVFKRANFLSFELKN